MDSYIIDTHAHLYLDQFDEDRGAMIERAKEAGVRQIFLPNIDLSTIDAMERMVTDYPGTCFAMMGLHPCNVQPGYESVLDEMEEKLENGKYIGVGETGVDLYWDKTYQAEQIKSFERQLEWGKATGLPVVIHSRDSLALNIDIVEKAQDGRLKAVFHCFNGTVEQAQRINDMNCHIGLGGVITFKNGGMKEILAKLNMSHIVLETDAPYLTPTPYRGKRNESSYTSLVAKVLSEEAGLSIEEVMDCTTTNALELFSLVEKWKPKS